MHNLDRTTAEFEDSREFEYENEGEYEFEDEYNGEGEYEFEDEYNGEDGYEFEDEYEGAEFEDNEEAEYEGEDEGEYEQEDYESPFSEEEEMELATELLNVRNEEELDQFLGLLAPLAGSLLKSAVPFLMRKAAPYIKKAAPFINRAIGSEDNEFEARRRDFRARRDRPAHRGYRPAHRGYRPAHRGYRPAHRGYGPAYRGYRPAYRGYRPAYGGYVPAYRGYGPAAYRGHGSWITPQLMDPLLRVLKQIYRYAMPVPGYVPAPQDIPAPPDTDMPILPNVDMKPAEDPAATAAGSVNAEQAAELFGLEMEGMSYEDREFEMARRFVNLAGETFRQADKLQSRMPLDQIPHKALELAANRYAPGLNRPLPYVNYDNRGYAGYGRWQRQGNNFTLFGLRRIFPGISDTGGTGNWGRVGNRIVLYGLS